MNLSYHLTITATTWKLIGFPPRKLCFTTIFCENDTYFGAVLNTIKFCKRLKFLSTSTLRSWLPQELSLSGHKERHKKDRHLVRDTPSPTDTFFLSFGVIFIRVASWSKSAKLTVSFMLVELLLPSWANSTFFNVFLIYLVVSLILRERNRVNLKSCYRYGLCTSRRLYLKYIKSSLNNEPAI